MEQGDTLLNAFAERFMDFVPRLGAAILVLLAGWVLARLLRLLTERGFGALDRLYLRYSSNRGERSSRWRPELVQTVSGVVFWLTLLVSAFLAASLLGLAVVSSWVNAVVLYLPTLAAGIAIVIAGLLVAALARELTVRAASNSGFQDSETLGRLVQILLILCAVVIGASQMGIDVSLLVYLATVLVAAVVGAFALSFGLATPDHVNNLISARYVLRRYEPGDRIRVGDVTGRILDITPRSVILETDQGEMQVPARRFCEEPILKLAGEDSDES
ncbi:MAG: mechanosensitive ion channel [Xanthomonadales bacterium]|nr:mechanosensitive ion channel [Xanthomonadales bacterium]